MKRIINVQTIRIFTALFIVLLWSSAHGLGLNQAPDIPEYLYRGKSDYLGDARLNEMVGEYYHEILPLPEIMRLTDQEWKEKFPWADRYVGLYSPEKRAIYVREFAWYDETIVIHELVHYYRHFKSLIRNWQMEDLEAMRETFLVMKANHLPFRWIYLDGLF